MKRTKKELRAQLARAKELWQEEVTQSAVLHELVESMSNSLALAQYSAAQYQVLLKAVLANGDVPEELIQRAESINTWQHSVIEESG